MRTRGDERGAEEEEGEEEDNNMVVVAGGIIPTRDHNFILGRGDTDGGKESRCCDDIFCPGNLITAAAVEELRLINGSGEGENNDLYMISNLRPPPRTQTRPQMLPLHTFLFCGAVLFWTA